MNQWIRKILFFVPVILHVDAMLSLNINIISGESNSLLGDQLWYYTLGHQAGFGWNIKCQNVGLN